MLIDCDTCPVRGQACAGCVVTWLFAQAPPVTDGDDPTRQAIAVLTEAGFEVTVLETQGPRPRSAARRRRGGHAA